jgi:hypothetical protein
VLAAAARVVGALARGLRDADDERADREQRGDPPVPSPEFCL